MIWMDGRELDPPLYGLGRSHLSPETLLLKQARVTSRGQNKRTRRGSLTRYYYCLECSLYSYQNVITYTIVYIATATSLIHSCTAYHIKGQTTLAFFWQGNQQNNTAFLASSWFPSSSIVLLTFLIDRSHTSRLGLVWPLFHLGDHRGNVIQGDTPSTPPWTIWHEYYWISRVSLLPSPWFFGLAEKK